MLVAVHPWDIEGARRAGLRTAWINRGRTPYPAHFGAPDVIARDFVALAGRLAR
jgi:2-haloacid dehalogenase